MTLQLSGGTDIKSVEKKLKTKENMSLISLKLLWRLFFFFGLVFQKLFCFYSIHQLFWSVSAQASTGINEGWYHCVVLNLNLQTIKAIIIHTLTSQWPWNWLNRINRRAEISSHCARMGLHVHWQHTNKLQISTLQTLTPRGGVNVTASKQTFICNLHWKLQNTLNYK